MQTLIVVQATLATLEFPTSPRREDWEDAAQTIADRYGVEVTVWIADGDQRRRVKRFWPCRLD